MANLVLQFSIIYTHLLTLLGARVAQLVYRLCSQGVGVQFQPVARDFSLFHSIWIGYRAQPDSFSVSTGGNLVRVLSLPLTLMFLWHWECMELQFHFPMCLCSMPRDSFTYHYPNTVCLVRSSGMRKTGHAYTGEMRNAYNFFTGKSEEKRPLDQT